MSMLAFIPWLKLTEPITEGPFHLFPQGVGDVLPEGVASAISRESMAKILGQYRNSANFPLPAIPVLQYANRPIGTDLSDDEQAAIFEFGQHLAVVGMSDRRFIGGFPDHYTAAGHYQMVIQMFAEPYSGGVTLTHRRKGGQSTVGMGQSDIQFVRPAHLVSQGEPELNPPLLTALQALCSLPKEVKEHVDASLTQFLLANTDSPDVPLEAESIATYAALERVSNSDQSLQDIRRKLPALFALVDDDTPWTARLRRNLGLPALVERPVLRAWLQHLYSLRSTLAHGKPAHRALQQWSQQEHLVAGAFTYPLALKCLLAQHELYCLTLEDVAWTLGLEKLLDSRPFFEVELDPQEESGLSEVTPLDALALRSAHRRRMSRWQRQFDDINVAIFGVALSGDIREVLEEQDGETSTDAKPD